MLNADGCVDWGDEFVGKVVAKKLEKMSTQTTIRNTRLCRATVDNEENEDKDDDDVDDEVVDISSRTTPLGIDSFAGRRGGHRGVSDDDDEDDDDAGNDDDVVEDPLLSLS